jgi:hypothetical protein
VAAASIPEVNYVRVFLAIVSDIRNRRKVFQYPLIVYEIVALLHSPRCNIQKELANLRETGHAFVAHDYGTSKIPTLFLPRMAIIFVSNPARHLFPDQAIKKSCQMVISSGFQAHQDEQILQVSRGKPSQRYVFCSELDQIGKRRNGD